MLGVIFYEQRSIVTKLEFIEVPIKGFEHDEVGLTK